MSTDQQVQKPPLAVLVPAVPIVRSGLFGEDLEFVVQTRGDGHSVPLFVTLAVEYLIAIGAFSVNCERDHRLICYRDFR